MAGRDEHGVGHAPQQHAGRLADARLDAVDVVDPVLAPDGQHGLASRGRPAAPSARAAATAASSSGPGDGQQRRDRVHVAPRDVAVGELAVDAHAVERVLAEQVGPDHRARDQPAHGRVQAGGRDQLVGARGEQLAHVARVGQHAQRGRDPRPALRGDVVERLAQLAHDRALARPAVDEDERLVPVARHDVLERAPVDPAAAHDRDAVVRRVDARAAPARAAARRRPASPRGPARRAPATGAAPRRSAAPAPPSAAPRARAWEASSCSNSDS